MLICESCTNECFVMRAVDSFTHEFGVEETELYVSECCGSSISDEDGSVYDQYELEQIWEAYGHD